MNKILTFVVLIIGLAACTATQFTKTETVVTQTIPTDIAVACSLAMGLTPIAAQMPQAAALVPFVVAGCAGAEGLAKLAADPASVAWLNQLIGQMKGLTHHA